MKTLIKGKVKQIIVNEYWDSHGNSISWGKQTHKFDTEKEFKIVSKKEEIFGVEFDVWNIFVDGKQFDEEFELTGYTLKDTKLILNGCVGAG